MYHLLHHHHHHSFRPKWAITFSSGGDLSRQKRLKFLAFKRAGPGP